MATYPITSEHVSRAVKYGPLWRQSQIMAAVKELQEGAALAEAIAHYHHGAAGVDKGGATDGVLLGSITPQDPTKFLLASHARAPLCVIADSGLLTTETTDIGEDTADDVQLFADDAAVGDAVYLGDATVKFGRADVNITTKQVSEVLTGEWQYWDSVTEDWAACQIIADATEGLLVDATGWATLTFVPSANWGKCTVNGLYGYWIRNVLSVATSITTGPLAGQAFVVQAIAAPLLVVTDDGGVQTVETVDAYDAGADDFDIWADDQEADDAVYFGDVIPWSIASIAYGQETDSDATLIYEAWNGSSWIDVTDDVTDASVGFTETASTKTITIDTAPTGWTAVAVAGVTAYWLRIRVSVAGTVAQGATGSTGYITTNTGNEALTETFSDDTTDATDAGAADVPLLPTYPVLNDAAYWIHETKDFWGIKLTTSQAATGTHTLVFEYSKADGTWGTLTVLQDTSAGYTVTAGIHWINWLPPSDWASVTINGQAGYAIRCRLSAMTSVTQQPIATQTWVRCSIPTAGVGIPIAAACNLERVTFGATANAGAAADSKFLALNITAGTAVVATWTMGTLADADTGLTLAFAADDQVVLVHAKEDGTAEGTNVNFRLGFEMAA